MKFKYRIIPEKKLIVERYSGEIGVRDLLKFQSLLGRDDDYSADYNELYDLRDAEFIFNWSEISIIVHFLQNNVRLLGQRRIVHLTNSPSHVANSLLFQSAAESLPMEIKTVSTLETAISYLHTQKSDIFFIESILEDLKWNAVLV